MMIFDSVWAARTYMVAPSVGEAFGSVYLEAMSAGLPVVATTTGGPPTFLNLDVHAPEGWLIPPDDEDALVEVLVNALTSPTEPAGASRCGTCFGSTQLLLACSRRPEWQASTRQCRAADTCARPSAPLTTCQPSAAAATEDDRLRRPSPS